MSTHFERTFEKDLERIREKISRMGTLGERALRLCLQALQERNRQLAYAVILGDRRIDELEKELDRVCLEFLVRQQPVAAPLRFAYSTIRISLELERIGDYAESIARQVLKILGMKLEIPIARYEEIARLSIPMLHDAVQAFVRQDPELARRTMQVEEEVDVLRNTINAELFQLRQEEKIPLEALTPLMTIARRFERVSDQAKNICQEVIYSSTGEYTRHPGEGIYRVLFVDEHDSCRAPMAEAIGQSLGQPDFLFTSAGIEPRPLDPATVDFLKTKGIETSHLRTKRLDQIKDLEHYDVIIGLAREVQKSLPPPPRKTVFLDWSVDCPATREGTAEEVRAAYELTYQDIHSHLQDLIEAIVGEDTR